MRRLPHLTMVTVLIAALLPHSAVAATAGFIVPVIESLDAGTAYPGESIQIRGHGFGLPLNGASVLVDGAPFPAADTYWSDSLVIFDLPFRPGPAVSLQIRNSSLIPSNMVSVEVAHPTRVFFIRPEPDAVLSSGPVRIQVAPEFDDGTVTQVTFSYRRVGEAFWTTIATDTDGATIHPSTVGWIGAGDGWSASWNPVGAPEGDYELRAVAIDRFGATMTGISPVLVDPTPLAPRIDDVTSILTGSKVEPDHALVLEGELTDEEIEELLLKWHPIHWHNERVLVPVDQDTLRIKDRNGNDVSFMACGPAAAASCLKWFADRFPELDQPIDELARKLAKAAGTNSKGTRDDRLAAAIRKVLVDKGVDTTGWSVTVKDDPTHLFGDMINEFAREKCDVIPLIQQKSTVDVNGDQVVDSTDVVGHFVTLSSRGTRAIDGIVGTFPNEIHVMGRETYVDFMNPATGQKEVRLLDDTKFPPVLKGFEVNDDVKDSAWIASAIVVCPPATGPVPNVVGDQILAQMPIPGPGRYSFSIPPGSLTDGDSFLGLFGRTANGTEDGSWRLALVGGYSHVAFSASPVSGPAPLTVSFLNQSAPTDSVVAWSWDFQADGFPDATGPNATFTYGTPGIYSVELQAEHPHGVDLHRAHQLVVVTGSTSAEGSHAPPAGLALAGRTPFRGSIAMSATLARGGLLRVQIFDPLGRRVRTLADGRRAAGKHDLVWDGRNDAGADCPSGVYLVRMVSPDGAFQRRLVRIR